MQYILEALACFVNCRPVVSDQTPTHQERMSQRSYAQVAGMSILSFQLSSRLEYLYASLENVHCNGILFQIIVKNVFSNNLENISIKLHVTLLYKIIIYYYKLQYELAT